MKAVILNDYKMEVSNLFFDEGFDITEKTMVGHFPMNLREINRVKDTLLCIEETDVLVFTGGTDISCSLYGQSRKETTDSPDIDRDIFEVLAWRKARLSGVPCVGICRGAQLLNVLSGGSLKQHSDRHYSGHNILTAKESFWAPANHHQVMIPGKLSTIFAKDSTGDSEVIYYPSTKSLCHQPHPEWVRTEPKTYNKYYNYFFNQVELLIKGGL